MKLDKKDMKILAAIEMGARLSYQQIGRETGLSKESVIYRMKRLEKRGIVSRYNTLVDFGKLGYTGFAIYSRFENVDDRIKDEIISYLSSLPELYWLATIGGKYDLVFAIACKTVFEFNQIYHQILNKYGEHLVDNTIAIRTELRQNKRGYLSESRTENFKAPYFGREVKVEEIDNLDQKILSELSVNARIPIIELAEILKAPASTVSIRIKNLEKKGIIQRYWSYIRPQSFGMQSYRLLLHIESGNEQVRKQLFQYVHDNPHAILAIETVGSWNFEMAFEVEDQQQIQQEVATLRKSFKDVLKNIELIVMFEGYLTYDPYPFLKNERKAKIY